jgi:glutamate 5-kinase
VGDNDTLGALVANLIEADALIILTDQPGLYTADPRKNPMPNSSMKPWRATPPWRRWPAAPVPAWAPAA